MSGKRTKQDLCCDLLDATCRSAGLATALEELFHLGHIESNMRRGEAFNAVLMALQDITARAVDLADDVERVLLPSPTPPTAPRKRRGKPKVKPGAGNVVAFTPPAA